MSKPGSFYIHLLSVLPPKFISFTYLYLHHVPNFHNFWKIAIGVVCLFQDCPQPTQMLPTGASHCTLTQSQTLYPDLPGSALFYTFLFLHYSILLSLHYFAECAKPFQSSSLCLFFLLGILNSPWWMEYQLEYVANNHWMNKRICRYTENWY